MNKWLYVLASVCALAMATQFPSANAQGGGYPIADRVAEKVIAHYQGASCEQLMAQKAQPPAPEEAQMKQRAVQLMRNDPGLRTYFLNKVAAPIANKLFECGMIP
jgi:hypothetical protein